MTDPDPKARLLEQIEHERQHWRDLVAEVGEERMTEPGPMGEWSFKDLAAHLLGWRNRTIARLEATAAGHPEPPSPWPAELDGEDDDQINAWIHDQHRDRSPADVLADVDASYGRLAAAIAAQPDEKVGDPGAYPWLDGEALAGQDLFSHLHEEHEPSIREWLDRGAVA